MLRNLSHLLFVIFFMIISCKGIVHAHESVDGSHPQAHVIPTAIERNIVQIVEDGAYRYIRSNGIPNHRTGQFPNRNNPNAISEQNHEYRAPINPLMTGQPKEQRGVIGVAVNGIPIEPGTAECYGRTRGQRGPMSGCDWREEAIINGNGQLGLDNNNAHVQPTGAYHYHGVPYGLLGVLSAQGDRVHVGYAADGFRILVSMSDSYKSSYRLKSGNRPDGPGGRYDGTYTADFSFIEGSGNLDQCNGAIIGGEYVYFMTKEFPFAPRCLMGLADVSFSRHGSPAMGQGNQGLDRQNGNGFPQGGHPPPRPF